MMDLPANDLKALGREFHSFVAARFQPPWKATASVLEYFALDVITVYLRGDQEGEAPPEWYVQLTFSGCAGMADVSSELATHWAERWYEADSERIANTLLRPHGFEPSGRTLGVGSGTLFVPIGAGGYATFSPTPREVDDDAERAESRYFEVDESVLETLDESELPDDVSQQTCRRWNSLQHMTLMVALEEHFGVRLSMADMTAMKSLPLIVATLARYAETAVA
jgi:acyl carrier protein